MNEIYWLFNCNPKYWAIDEFIENGSEFTTWNIGKSKPDNFKIGQLGVIRVSIDKRNKEELSGREKLKSGIYAIVEIIDEPKKQTDILDMYWLNSEKSNESAWRVKLKFKSSFLYDPILIKDLINLKELRNDISVLKGRQGSVHRLSENGFKKILDLTKDYSYTLKKIQEEIIYDENDIKKLEIKYQNAKPTYRSIISKKIERGEISRAVKKFNNFECQICKAMGLTPFGFKKKNGEFYIETHHVFPVSDLKKGVLGLSNLMTLCANHHRQMHFGNIELISNTKDAFTFRIDNELVKIKKFSYNN